MQYGVRGRDFAIKRNSVCSIPAGNPALLSAGCLKSIVFEIVLMAVQLEINAGVLCAGGVCFERPERSTDQSGPDLHRIFALTAPVEC